MTYLLAATAAGVGLHAGITAALSRKDEQAARAEQHAAEDGQGRNQL